MRQILKIIFCFCLLLGIGCPTEAQTTVYNGVNLNAGSSLTPLPFSIIQSGGTKIFEAENEIVIGPDCITYPTCSGSNNEFYTSGYFDVNSLNYFLARLAPPAAYAELKRQLDGSYCEVINKKLRFKYVEKYVEGNLNYQIYDFQRNSKITLPITDPNLLLSKKVGENFFTIDLSLISSFANTTEDGSYYTLEVTNEKNEKTVLRFRYVPNE